MRGLRVLLVSTATLGVLAAGAPALAAPPAYTVRHLGVWEATGLDDHGAVVGTAGSGAVLWRAGVLRRLPLGSAAGISSRAGYVVGQTRAGETALWRRGSLRNLGRALGDGFPTDVNDSGHVTGVAFPPNRLEQALRWNGRRWVRLFPGVNRFSRAHALNNAGDVVGNAGNAAHGRHLGAALWSNGDVVDLGTPCCDDFDDTALDINEAGNAVGYFSGPTTNRLVPFVWTRGSLQRIPLPRGFPDAVAHAINESGTIVGAAGDVAFEDPAAATVWIDRQPYLLARRARQPRDVIFYRAIDVNEAGQILVLGVEDLETVHSYLLTPR